MEDPGYGAASLERSGTPRSGEVDCADMWTPVPVGSARQGSMMPMEDEEEGPENWIMFSLLSKDTDFLSLWYRRCVLVTTTEMLQWIGCDDRWSPAFNWLGNYAPSGIVYGASAGQLVTLCKALCFERLDVATSVCGMEEPYEQAFLGLRLEDEDKERKWRACCHRVVFEVNYRKFASDEPLRWCLLQTTGRRLVSEPPWEEGWWIDRTATREWCLAERADYSGLGGILEQVRTRLYRVELWYDGQGAGSRSMSIEGGISAAGSVGSIPNSPSLSPEASPPPCGPDKGLTGAE